jgi:hypothetical protein
VLVRPVGLEPPHSCSRRDSVSCRAGQDLDHELRCCRGVRVAVVRVCPSSRACGDQVGADQRGMQVEWSARPAGLPLCLIGDSGTGKSHLLKVLPLLLLTCAASGVDGRAHPADRGRGRGRRGCGFRAQVPKLVGGAGEGSGS